MIPNEITQTIETVGFEVKKIADFRATDQTMPRILVDMSDRLYNRKELAVTREYSTNAADAMVKAGLPISDMIVTLPTYEDLTFRVRDFGEGLSEEKIADVYCVLGESDKRNSNDYNGMFGYGCKAGFSHADSFTVTSWCDGVKSIYQCVKGDTRKVHTAFLLSRCLSDEPTGIEIAVPVKQSSMWTFQQEAVSFFRYWEVLPTIKGMGDSYHNQLETYRQNKPTLQGEGWEIRPGSGSAKGVVFMGYVAYPMDWEVLWNKMALTQETRPLFELLKSNNVVIFSKIGEVTFVPSREGLEYTEETLKVLIGKIKDIFAKIKESIQNKFNPLPNLWEAKKMYNSIFGTGILELEKGEDTEDTFERIRILDGNLIKLEQVLSGQFVWNGIPILSPFFKHIHRFDNNDPQNIGGVHNNPISPVMITYRKKKQRVKVNRCSNDRNNSITASLHVAVVINDTGLRTGIQQVARYLIFNTNSKIKVVHVLKFDSSATKELFYKEYNFDSVPVLKLSELTGPAKVWNSSNKSSRNYGGGGGGSRSMKYINMATGEVEESEVTIRDIENGGYFINIGTRGTVLLADKIRETDPECLTPLRTIAEYLDIDLDRVYIISNQTAQAKWFNQAIESGEWINIWSYIQENLDSLDVKPFVDAKEYAANFFICESNATLISSKIFDKNSPLLKFIKIVANPEYPKLRKVVAALQEMKLWDTFANKTKPTIPFQKEAEKIIARYPLIETSNLHCELPKASIKHISQYINAMDLWIDMAPDPEPVEKSS